MAILKIDKRPWDVEDEAWRATFEKDILDSSNTYRARHHSPPLTANSEIAKVAQEWANHLAKINKTIHRPNNRYGENIFYKWHRKHMISGVEVSQSFYNEIKYYYPYFQKEPNLEHFHRFGHFSQMLWRETEEMGTGIAVSGDKIFVVINYHPRGNWPDEYAMNVLPVVIESAARLALINSTPHPDHHNYVPPALRGKVDKEQKDLSPDIVPVVATPIQPVLDAYCDSSASEISGCNSEYSPEEEIKAVPTSQQRKPQCAAQPSAALKDKNNKLIKPVRNDVTGSMSSCSNSAEKSKPAQVSGASQCHKSAQMSVASQYNKSAQVPVTPRYNKSTQVSVASQYNKPAQVPAASQYNKSAQVSATAQYNKSARVPASQLRKSAKVQAATQKTAKLEARTKIQVQRNKLGRSSGHSKATTSKMQVPQHDTTTTKAGVEFNPDGEKTICAGLGTLQTQRYRDVPAVKHAQRIITPDDIRARQDTLTSEK